MNDTNHITNGEENKFSSPEYRRSRVAYVLYALFDYFVGILVADAFLAKLLSAMGFRDSEIGILASFISLAFVFQLFSLLLTKKRNSKKGMILVLNTLGQMFFFALYVLPLIEIDLYLRRALVYVFIIGAYMCKYLVSNFLFQWANGYVDPNKRGSYSATMEIVSLIGGIIFSLSMGAIFNWFESQNNLMGGFFFLAIVILISNILVFISLTLIKREHTGNAVDSSSKKLSDIFKNTLGNKNFRHLLVIAVLWKSAEYFTLGFMGPFKTDTLGNGLALSVLFVQVISIASSLIRMPFTNIFGKYSDKHSFASGFYLSLFIGAAAFLCNVFTTKETWFLVIAHTILYAVCAAGNGKNAQNMIYSYVDIDYIAEGMALQNCISGVCGFLCSLVAGAILEAVQQAGNMFFGIPMFGQQLLGLISALLCGICIIYMRATILKEKVIKQ
ncbi:MAG: MFS transporter [Clostridia bacterium]|nr:MFS transporter [Clostridia bacterium]